jgi:hypothetical protein
VRFPSLVDARERASSTAARFPFVLLAAVVAAGAALVAVDDGENREVVRLVFTAALALPLLFACAATGERRRWSGALRVASAAGAVVVLVVLHLVARGWPDHAIVTRYLHSAVAFHLLVAVLPFLGAGTLLGFWQFNRILFLRFLLASLYTAVLFGGLAVALLAIDNLFGVDIDGVTYLRLWVLLAFIFHPWFFLAGVPRDLEALDTLPTFPVGIKVFAQFVLIPLVSVYLLILSAYLVRVVVTRTWPSGWIGWLVSSVAAAGTLALLLVHPVRERPDARWVDAYGRWFYVGLLPSIGMLLMAIGLRLGQYGFTEPRYFLLVLALWLTAIALFYAATGSRNIRVIPATLAALALVTFLGPWSAYAVSRRSQADRLQAILVRHGVLSDGAVRAATAAVPPEDTREISAIVRYLVRTHGPESLADVHDSLATIAAADASAVNRSSEPIDDPVAAAVVGALGVDYVSMWQARDERSERFFAATDERTPVDIAGFDLHVRADVAQPVQVPVGNDTLGFSPVTGGTVQVRWRGRDIGVLRIDSMLAGLDGVLRGPSRREVSPTPPTLDFATDALRLRLSFRHLTGERPGEGRPLRLDGAMADVLIDVR